MTTPGRPYLRVLSKKAKTVTLVFAATVLIGLAMTLGQQVILQAQIPAPPVHQVAKLGSLKTVSVPEPRNLAGFVKDKNAAIALGKALFWDMAVGSDGQACASCHFHAGADSRSVTDFPFHKLADPNNQDSVVLFDTNDVTSSAGVFGFTFTGIAPIGPFSSQIDLGNILNPDPVFNVGGINVRGVEPRNTPTVVNAVFNHRNFWDGRARSEFNGRNPIGNWIPSRKWSMCPRRVLSPRRSA